MKTGQKKGQRLECGGLQPGIRVRHKKHGKIARPLMDALREFAPNDLLTDEEAAQVLRLKAHTLRVWRISHAQPGLRFIRLNRTIRYQYADLLAYIESCKTTAGTAA